MNKRLITVLSLLILTLCAVTAVQAQITFTKPSASEPTPTAPIVPPSGGLRTSQEFFDAVDYLYDQGAISTNDGNFYMIEDFSDEWAQLQWYQWIPRTEINVKKFVVRAKIKYESASQTPNWADSGCGFMFRVKDTGTHLVANYTLDGNVSMHGRKDNYYLSYGLKKVYSPATSGEIEFVLYADGKNAGIMIDDQLIINRADVLLEEIVAPLFSVTFSGTNRDYGIRCEYSDIELMTIP